VSGGSPLPARVAADGGGDGVSLGGCWDHGSNRGSMAPAARRAGVPGIGARDRVTSMVSMARRGAEHTWDQVWPCGCVGLPIPAGTVEQRRLEEGGSPFARGNRS
jgi:hypothetical protein